MLDIIVLIQSLPAFSPCSVLSLGSAIMPGGLVPPGFSGASVERCRLFFILTRAYTIGKPIRGPSCLVMAVLTGVTCCVQPVGATVMFPCMCSSAFHSFNLSGSSGRHGWVTWCSGTEEVARRAMRSRQVKNHVCTAASVAPLVGDNSIYIE